MRTSRKNSNLLATGSRFLLPVLALVVAQESVANGAVQRGIFYFEPSGISLSNMASGVLCTDEDGGFSLCEPAIKIVVNGEGSCDWPEGRQSPCTRFGYEFEYADAKPGTSLECVLTRYSPSTGEQKSNYSRAIDAPGGRISFLGFRTWAAVDERVMQSEVHECAYLGEPVVSFEYIITWEPGVGPGAAGTAEKDFMQVPDACAEPYLTRDIAKLLLQVNGVDDHVATEHLPTLQSQCLYTAAGAPIGHVGYVFKFMLADLFDMDKVPLVQVDFNAKFANGGTDPVETMTTPGERAWFFRKGDRETLFMLTGFTASNDPAGRPRVLVAHYYIDDPTIDPQVKQRLLLEQAVLHMQHWRLQRQ